MAASAGEWATYDAWGLALEEAIFPPLEQSSPVYLDLEDDRLAALAQKMGVDAPSVVDSLLGAVRPTLDFATTHPYSAHSRRLLNWRHTDSASSPPPVLPLLAVFSLAAERMTQAEGMSSNNYYGRLADLLGTTAELAANPYREVAEPFWGSLNSWLTSLAGARGLPTAYSVGFRYVGLAISQALVREADRRRFQGFFTFFSFAPHSQTPPVELEPLLDAWIRSQQPSPAGSHLAALWGRDSLQPLIAEVAATELAEWDGTESQVDGVSIGRPRALLTLRMSTFPGTTIRLGMVLQSARPDESRIGLLKTVAGTVPIELDARDGRFVGLAGVGDSDLLEGVFDLDDPLVGRVIRRPKRLVVFARDSLSGEWVESNQVLLGDDVVALVRNDYLAEVEAVLEQVARPGWLARTRIAGLPDDWHLLTGVEVFARLDSISDRISDLSVLSPLTSSQLKIAGGLALPGRVRNRWHVDLRPEVLAVSDSGVPFSLALIDLGPDLLNSTEVVLETWEDEGSGALAVDLMGVELTDGEYAVEMRDKGAARPRARREFSLRSSDSPDLGQWATAVSIVHQLASPNAVMEVDEPPADDEPETGPVVQGVVIRGALERGAIATPSALPWWHSAASSGRPQVKLDRPVPDSCFFTGKHNEVIPRVELDRRGRPIESSVTGKCKYCGLERRYSSNYYQNARRHERRLLQQSPSIPTVSRLDMRPVRSAAVERDWDAALDALRFAGGGPKSTLARVATQIDSGAFFLRDFVETLDSMGHIEVRRDPETLDVLDWEVCASTVVELPDGLSFVGYWSPGLLAIVQEAVQSLGARIEQRSSGDGPRVSVAHVSSDDLKAVLEIEGVVWAGHAGRVLADSVHPISEVVASMKRTTRIPSIGLQAFEPDSTSWIDVALASSPGAYRTSGYARSYFIRTPEDIERSMAAATDVYLSKHAASKMLRNRSLVSYDTNTKELATPIGADLPGMYSRAVVLETQKVPFNRQGFRIYADVPETLAGRLTYLLEN